MSANFPDFLYKDFSDLEADALAVAASAKAALSEQAYALARNIEKHKEKPDNTRTDLSCDKAWAITKVRCGSTADAALLQQSILENWESFHKELKEAWEESGKSWAAGLWPWKMAVCEKWALPPIEGELPFSLWTDKALVQFFKVSKEFGIDGDGCTKDTWRKFRKEAGLKSMRFKVVRDFKIVKDRDGKRMCETTVKYCAADKATVKRCVLARKVAKPAQGPPPSETE